MNCLLQAAVAIALTGCATSRGVHWRYEPEPAGPQTVPWHPTEVPMAEPIAAAPAPAEVPGQAAIDVAGVPTNSSLSSLPAPTLAYVPLTQYQATDGFDQSTNKAVAALATSAERARARGDYEHAISALERALGIDSRNPYIWSDLAQIYLDQKMYEQAENMVQRAISLSRENPDLELRNQKIIAIIRQAKGQFATSPPNNGNMSIAEKVAGGG